MKLDSYLKFTLLTLPLVAHHDTATSGFEETLNSSDIFMLPRDNKVLLEKMPYVVWVTTEGNPSYGSSDKACTGTLIREDLVLTLASCLLHGRDDPNPDMTRVFEMPWMYELVALKIHINPNHFSNDPRIANAYDFGLIVVESSKKNVFPQIPRSLKLFMDIKDTCLMGGYGTNSEKLIKDKFEVFYMNKTAFNMVSGRWCLDEQILCLHLDGIIPCTMDIGSPLICDEVIYGLFTPLHGKERIVDDKCLNIYVTSFTLVYNVKNWVIDIMDNPTSNLEWLDNPFYVLLLCCAVIITMGSIYYGLVEFLQRTFDPADNLQTPAGFSPENEHDDEDSWYGSQWARKGSTSTR